MSAISGLFETVLRSTHGEFTAKHENRHSLNQLGNVIAWTAIQKKPGAAHASVQDIRLGHLPLRLDLQIVNTLLKQTQNERDQLRERLANTRSKSDEHEQLLSKALQQSEDANVKLRNELDEARSEGEKALRKSNDGNAKLQRALEEIRLHRKADQLNAQRLMQEAKDKDEELRGAHQQFSDLKQGNQVMKAKNRRSNKEIEKLTAELSVTKAELTTRLQECNSGRLVAGEHQRLLDAYDKLVQDHESQTAQIAAWKALNDDQDNAVDQQTSPAAKSRPRAIKVGKQKIRIRVRVPKLRGLSLRKPGTTRPVENTALISEDIDHEAEFTAVDQDGHGTSATLLDKETEQAHKSAMPLKTDREASEAMPALFDPLVKFTIHQQPPTCAKKEICHVPRDKSINMGEELPQPLLVSRGKEKSWTMKLGRLIRPFTYSRKAQTPGKDCDLTNTSSQPCEVEKQEYEAVSRLEKLKAMPKQSMKHIITIFRPSKEDKQSHAEYLTVVSETQSEFAFDHNEKSIDVVEDKPNKQDNEEHEQQIELGTLKSDNQIHENDVSTLNVHVEPHVPVAGIKLSFQNGESTCRPELQDLILEAYQKDKDLQAILRNLEQGKPVTALVNKSFGSISNLERIRVINGLIYYVDVYGPALCLPRREPIIYRVIKQVHESPAKGHADLKTTFECLRKQYYWPGMGGSVAAYVDACLICEGTKASTEAIRLLLPPTLPSSSNTSSKRQRVTRIATQPKESITPLQIATASKPNDFNIISHNALTKIQHVESIIQYTFTDKHLLWEALQAEGNGIKSSGPRLIPKGNLRLAKLGDKVLDLMIAWKGYEDGLMMQQINEVTYKLASNANLTHVCIEKGIFKYVNGRAKTESIKFKADIIESIIGAVALDSRADLGVVRRLLDGLGVLEWKEGGA